jgi:periplasmic protein TonB
MAIDSEEDHSNRWSSRELYRLLIPSTIATILFIGGVYWIRLQVGMGTPSQEQSTVLVQVHLLPRPDPVPIPLAPAPQTATVNVPNPADNVVDAPADTSSDAMADQPAQKPSARAIADLGETPVSAADASQSTAVLDFRQTLVRHIAKYQRYPKAAERGQLQGTVDTVFSMSRDGRLLEVWVKRSSGDAILDNAAIETIRRAQPLPNIPSALPDPLKVELALGFDPS